MHRLLSLYDLTYPNEVFLLLLLLPLPPSLPPSLPLPRQHLSRVLVLANCTD